MNTNPKPVVIDNETGDIMPDDHQADQAAIEVFGDPNHAQKTSGVIAHFVQSYSLHKNTMPLAQWLEQAFEDYPDIWADAAERHATALQVIEKIEQNNQTKADLYAHLDKGKSRESWLAKKIEQGASSGGVAEVGTYAQSIDAVLETANQTLRDLVFNKALDSDGNPVVNGNWQLHGLIAEADLANQFNINARTLGSTLTAEVTSTTTLNSPDIVIKDASGNVLEHVQVKLYQPNQTGLNSLIQNIKEHNYDSQTTLVVNKEHVAALREKFPDLRIVSEYEQGGVNMEVGEYADYKQQQAQAQLDAEIKQYTWNDANRLTIAKEIGRKAVIAAAFNAGFQGARILGRRAWNALNGKESRPANEDMQEFFNASLQSAGNVGVQVAVSGALVVAAKSGWLKILQNTPAGQIANIAYIGLENAKCLYKLAKGELNHLETLDAMGNVTCTAVGGIAGSVKGGVVGFALGGPVGAFVGAVAGGIAGSTVGDLVYNGAKAVAKTAAKVVESAWEGTKSVVQDAWNTVTSWLPW
jgi:outer membrane lipoprotein SlyB